MRRVMALLGCAGGVLVAAPVAGADGGGPFAAYQGGYGVSAPGGKSVYSALPVRGGTLVERFDRPSGSVLTWRVVRGNFGVPAAAGDGSTTGLSGDGHRLVLAEVTGNIPPARTRLLVLTGGLHVIERITLPGAFTVDAISPDGRWLYLIHYTSPHNLLRYEVRAYDLRAGRLLPKPVIDPREPDESMRGSAVTRVSSADGRWAYTLYVRPKGVPFVHALDTARRAAACIDLPGVSGADALGLRLGRDGAALRIVALAEPHGGSVKVLEPPAVRALIDTRTFAVTPPATRRKPASPRGDRGGPPAWPVVVLAFGVLAGVAGVFRMRRPARRLPA